MNEEEQENQEVVGQQQQEEEEGTFVIPPNTPIVVDANLVYNAAMVIHHSARRGTFHGNELTSVGKVHDQLIEVVRGVVQKSEGGETTTVQQPQQPQ